MNRAVQLQSIAEGVPYAPPPPTALRETAYI